MDKRRVELTRQQFDLVVHNHKEAQVEYWLARELMPLLGYERWENFDKAVIRAMESCETSGIEVTDHFREVTKMISLGSGSKRGAKDTRPLADFLPTLSIAAKNLAAEMTNYNVEEKDLQGERAITGEHVQNNRSVREMLGQRGIKPENLPPAEDIKKLERRVKSQERKIAAQSGRLPAPAEEGEENDGK